MSAEKPYRPNVGIALFNASGQVLIGRRFKDDGPEIILPGLEWQMPQGGIDADEDPSEAVMRELWEETGVSSAGYLGETGWLTYEFPPYAGPAHRLAKFRGQRQKWFALRFKGPESEINPLAAPGFFSNLPHDLQPLMDSGILLCAIAAVILNAFFNGLGGDAIAKTESAAAASSAQHV